MRKLLLKVYNLLAVEKVYNTISYINFVPTIYHVLFPLCIVLFILCRLFSDQLIIIHHNRNNKYIVFLVLKIVETICLDV